MGVVVALRGGESEPPEAEAASVTTSGVRRAESPAVARGPRGWTKGASWGAGALAVLVVGDTITGAIEFFIAGILLVYAILIVGFTRNQRRLAKRGSELATNVDQVKELIYRDASAFRRVITAIFPWRTEIELPAEPAPAQQTSSFPERPAARPAMTATPEERPPALHDPGGIESAAFPGAWSEKAAGAQTFWHALSATEQDALRAVARQRTYAPGVVLCREGQPADHVIVIKSGWTKVCVEHPEGERVIARRGPGDVVGERAALRVGARSATVVAIETVRALVVATDDFAAFLGDHPRLLSVLESQIYGRLTEDRDGPPAHGAADS